LCVSMLISIKALPYHTIRAVMPASGYWRIPGKNS